MCLGFLLPFPFFTSLPCPGLSPSRKPKPGVGCVCLCVTGGSGQQVGSVTICGLARFLAFKSETADALALFPTLSEVTTAGIHSGFCALDPLAVKQSSWAFSVN